MKSKIAFITALVTLVGALLGLGIMAQQNSVATEPDANHMPVTGTANSVPSGKAARTELAQAMPSAGAGGPAPVEAAPAAQEAPASAPEATEAPAETTEATPAESAEGAAPAEGLGVTNDFLDDEVVIYSDDNKQRNTDQALQTNDENLINVHLDDVEMVDVVRMFTQISGVNIITTPSNLQGRVTVSLTGVEWKPALQSILDMQGLSLIEKRPDSKVYTIVPRMGDVEPMTTETVFLKYSSVSGVNEVVKGLLPAGASSTPFPSRGALVIRTTSSNMDELRKLIENIDRVREQVFIEAKFMELSDEAISDLGINWQSMAGTTVTAGQMKDSLSDTKTRTKSRADTQLNTDSRSQQQTAVHGYDINGNEYPLITLEGSTADDSGNVTYFTSDDTLVGQSLESTISDSFSETFSDAKSAVLTATDFSAVLAALKQTDGVTVVSNPKIIVANEEPAVIHIGQTRRPFVSTVTPATATTAPIVSYNPGDRIDLGVTLNVTPTINTSSNITLRIMPELSRLDGEEVSGDLLQSYPIISTKSINTVFTLSSGKTVAIGGLTSTDEEEQTSKIPLLGDIPLIGKYLFSYSHESRAQSETLIFVTVSLADPESIDPDAGLPIDTELARKRMISEEIRHREIKDEITELKSAADEDDSLQDERIKDRLLKRVED